MKLRSLILTTALSALALTSAGAGAKTALSGDPHGIAAGLEVFGSFEDPDRNWAVLPGVYLPLGAPNITFKTGLQFGQEDGADALRVHMSLMYRF